MSERMTAIYLPSLRQGAGWAECGRRSPNEMIDIIRGQAARQKAEAEAILAAADVDFRIETYVGVHVQKQLEVLQEGGAA